MTDLPGIRKNDVKRVGVFALLVFLQACASSPVDQVNLMPAPDIFANGLPNPLPETDPFSQIPYGGVLFATDRAPASEGDKEAYYRNEVGRVLRVGVAQVQLGSEFISWEKAREISMLKSRTENYPVRVAGVAEWGVIEDTVPFWVDAELEAGRNPPKDATAAFVDAINAQLGQSAKEDVYIYIHGYKVVFENPVLVASELWHFLGYEGAFIAYSWPSTPSRFAYIRDSDTSNGYARNLRLLIETIASKTDAESINIVGYSNGTRLVARALEQLALIHQGKSREDTLRATKLGNVILTGSDLDRGAFGSYVADGMLNVCEHLSIYLSEHDQALGVSRFLTNRERLGQLWANGEDMSPSTRAALGDLSDRLSFINVSEAEGSNKGNGHGYFRSSPWASSDILMSLYFDVEPDGRGLVQQEDLPIFRFPENYPERLSTAIDALRYQYKNE